MTSDRKLVEQTVLASVDAGGKVRTQKELVLLSELLSLLTKRAGGREIARLKSYEE